MTEHESVDHARVVVSPGLGKGVENESPIWIYPELKSSGPLFMVTVCTIESLLYQVTVVPTVTFRGVGENVKFTISTVAFPVETV